MNNINFQLMRKSIVVLLVLFLASCQKKETEPVVKPVDETLKTADLYSKVYYISTELNTEDCVAYNYGCDCCDGKIVFLENGNFVTNFYCVPNEIYTTGTFEVKGNKIILNLSDKVVTYGPAKEDYSQEEESKLRLESFDHKNDTLNIIRCKKSYIFKNKTDYYSEDKKTSFTTAVNEFKNIGAWKLLDVKE